MWFVAGVGLMVVVVVVFFFFFFPLSLSLLVAGFLVELKAIVMWLWFVGAMMVVVG